MQASDFRGPPVEDRSETRRVGRADRAELTVLVRRRAV